MADVTEIPAQQRDRSPAFPIISLQTALERLTQFETHFKRSPARAEKVGDAWNIGTKAYVDRIAAALRYFGLLEYQGAGKERHVVVSEEGRKYLKAQQEETKREVIRATALRPKAIAKAWEEWGNDRPADAACIDWLVQKDGFSVAGARDFLKVYDATISFAGLVESDKNLHAAIGKGKEDDQKPPPPSPPVKLGDHIQWTSGGVDQFRVPRKVIGFLDDQRVQVFGSNTGVPVSELAVVPAPRAEPAPVTIGDAINGSVSIAGDNDFSVLQRGNRLQITADVDLEGIAMLKDMLADYESILKRLAPKKA